MKLANREVTRTGLIPALTLAALLLAACTESDPVRVENDFGHSVQQMIRNQTDNHKAGGTASAAPTTGLDGVQAEAVMKKHREHVGDPSNVDKDIKMQVSQPQS